jgi:hypothetical protein
MNILKKALMVCFIINIAGNSQASDINTGTITKNYDTVLLFAQDLRSNTSTSAYEHLAQWLEEQLLHYKDSKEYQSALRIIENRNLTLKSKLVLLSELISHHKREQKVEALRYASEIVIKGLSLAVVCNYAYHFYDAYVYKNSGCS